MVFCLFLKQLFTGGFMMKKVLIGSTLAVGLLLSGAGQSPASANSVGLNSESNAINLPDMDTETALQMVQQERANLLENQSNSQQMDMLRLQSLTNKRNEAFDVMTDFVKKMQDSRSSIIGNMR